jgi:hypothetical protein
MGKDFVAYFGYLIDILIPFFPGVQLNGLDGMGTNV